MTVQHDMILNQTSPTNFLVDIPDNDYVNGLILSVQGVTLPGMNIPISTVPLNPLIMAHIPGSAIEFDPLIIRFVVDDNLSSYLGVYTWMLGTVDYNNHDSVRWFEKDQSIAVHMLDNSQSRTVATFRFYGAWPSNLSELEYMYTNDQDEAIFCIATFNFKYMEIEVNGKVVQTQYRKS